MITKFKYLIFIILALIAYKVKSQDALGLGFSNYSGISGRNINPAFLTGSKVYLDVNIVSADVFMENDFAYIPKDSAFVRRFLKGETFSTNYGPYKYDNFFDYYKGKSNYSFTAAITVTGPSFMVQNGKQAYGGGVAFRSLESFYKFPGQILRTWYMGGPDASIINKEAHFRDFQIASLSWSELFFNYAVNFYERYGNKLTAGIEVKYLFGVEGFFMSIKDVKYYWMNRNKINIDTLNAAVSFALPVNYDNNLGVNLNPWAKGHGVGANIGIMYTKEKKINSAKGKKPLCANTYDDYQYRIGLSIMDIGGIRFNRFTRMYQSDIGRITKILTPFNNYDDIASYFKPLISQSARDTSVFMSLPTAVSLQFDYHFRKHVYFSGFWVHPLRFQNKSVRRPAQLAFIPRYESRLLGISLPFSWYDYQKLRLGLAIRLYTVTIGTEKLGAFLGKNDFNGMDFYFSVKFNLQKGKCSPWNLGACQRTHKSKRKKNVK